MATVAAGISGAEGPFAQRGHTGPLMASGKKVADVGLEWPYTTKESKMTVDQRFERALQETTTSGNATTLAVPVGAVVRRQVVSMDDIVRALGIRPDMSPPNLIGGFVNLPDYLAMGGFDIEGPDGQSQWWREDPSSPERWKEFQARK